MLVLAMTREEAHELFTRCLRSQEEDNEASESILTKLAYLLEKPSATKIAA